MLELTNAYVELMNMKKYEDALIFHLMYPLSINLETVLLLTFDSIGDNNRIRFLNTLDEKYMEVCLNQDLLRDILFSNNLNLKIT